MLHVNGLTYRIGPRVLFDNATVALPPDARVGFLGRNGTGKTTLFRMIMNEASPDLGTVSVPRGARIGRVAQEAPGGPEKPDRGGAGRRRGAHRAPGRGGDRERSAPHRRDPDAPRRQGRPCRAGPRRRDPGGPRLRPSGPAARLLRILRRLAHARRPGGTAVHRAGPAAARRADQLSRPRRHALASRTTSPPTRTPWW